MRNDNPKNGKPSGQESQIPTGQPAEMPNRTGQSAETPNRTGQSAEMQNRNVQPADTPNRQITSTSASQDTPSHRPDSPPSITPIIPLTPITTSSDASIAFAAAPAIHHSETHKSLIVRMQRQQDNAAWHDFVAVYESFLRQVARRYGVPERDVPDVVQQMLMAISRSIGNWQDDGQPASFRRWLRTVARNVTMRFVQQQVKHPSPAGGTDHFMLVENLPSKVDANTEQSYEHELIIWAAQQVATEFIETSWKAFWLTVVDQQPVEAVAENLKLTPGAIYMSRSRIMKRIRAKIAELEDDRDDPTS